MPLLTLPLRKVVAIAAVVVVAVVGVVVTGTLRASQLRSSMCYKELTRLAAASSEALRASSSSDGSVEQLCASGSQSA